MSDDFEGVGLDLLQRYLDDQQKRWGAEKTSPRMLALAELRRVFETMVNNVPFLPHNYAGAACPRCQFETHAMLVRAVLRRLEELTND